ncbi:hypothetical protein FIBSPDRAFT_926153 [Athelia psychrophila]|uniref:CENP-V/GFA domain-containing protein n=1 Tax=Athelia psychrophila TaxID=1759441 RepID=A0A166TXV5_9AGAM|nr:hypothetical protein FIBSPDRAFT_926153 [Fibularhizoctonia sp. CBS 109695]
MSSTVVPPPPSTVNGSCNCGAITLAIPSDAFPSHSIICRCISCRTSGGSLFSVDLMVPAERVIVSSGQTKVYHDMGSSGKFVKRHFCGDCGSPIFSDLENTPGIAFVKGGLFCASGFDLPPPRAQLFWRNHEDWETSIEGVALQE